MVSSQMGICRSSNFINIKRRVTHYGMEAVKNLLKNKTNDVVLFHVKGNDVIIHRYDDRFYVISESENEYIPCIIGYTKNVIHYFCLLLINGELEYIDLSVELSLPLSRTD